MLTLAYSNKQLLADNGQWDRKEKGANGSMVQKGGNMIVHTGREAVRKLDHFILEVM